MNYENYDEITSKVGQIKKLQKTLDQLSQPEVNVIVSEKDPYDRIMTIGTSSNSEHQYAEQSRLFVGQLKNDHESRIQKLKDELQQL